MWLGLSLAFLTLTYDQKIGSVYLIMLAIDYFIFDKLPSRIDQNQIPRNTPEAFISAFIAFLIFFVTAAGISLLLQGAAFVQGNLDPSTPVQSILRHGFAATGLNPDQPIFANSKPLTYYTFALVIPFIETRMLVRLLEYMAKIFNVSLDYFSFKLGAIYIAIASLFVWLHVNVKGVEDNVALIMTFIFALITFELVRRGSKIGLQKREMESATYLHVINNLVFIYTKIGF